MLVKYDPIEKQEHSHSDPTIGFGAVGGEQ